MKSSRRSFLKESAFAGATCLIGKPKFGLSTQSQSLLSAQARSVDGPRCSLPKRARRLRCSMRGDRGILELGLLRRLWRAPSAQHSFRPLSALTKYWSDQTLAQIEQWPDAGLVHEGLRLFGELPRTQPTELLLATDLHAGNVLRAERQPWLVIDPKPFVGDPAYDATQHLLNCSARLQSDPDATIRSFADLLGVGHERVRLWTFARAAAEPRDDWSNGDRVAFARAIAP
jgi:hypothetical protein